MENHLRILGVLYLAAGALYLLGAVAAATALTGTGLLAGDLGVLAFLSGLGIFLAVLLAVLGLPSLLVGYGLLQRRGWARVLGLVVGFLNLFSFPVGTVLGGYTLWALFQPETERLLARPAGG